MKITQKSVRVLETYWKKGHICRYDLPVGSRVELKRLGLIEYDEKKFHYVINRELYNDMRSGKQTCLNGDNDGGCQNRKF